MAEAVAAETRMRRTVRMAASVASQLAEPSVVLSGGHAVGKGFMFKIEGADDVDATCARIAEKIKDLVASKEPIARETMPWQDVLDYFDEHGLQHSKALVESRVEPQVPLYQCRGCLRLAVHELLDDCGALASVNIKVQPGSVRGTVLVTFASGDYVPQPALVDSFRDHLAFSESLGVDNVGKLNGLQQVGRGRMDFVLQCEFRQEQKLASITSAVLNRSSAGSPVKLICVAGPTSSGKTTFASKLCMYLRNAGFQAKSLTVDHYYLPLDKQPKYQARQQRSDVDYDHIESMDVELVGQHLNELIAGKAVHTPIYNMKTGYRDGEGHRFEPLSENGILIIEGIHALNPLYTQTVDVDKVYRIFISPLTALQVDDFNCVKTTDHRLLRRMCRDYLFRGNSASVTLRMWDNVRRGEGEWIFPHQNNADFVMNSAAEYEIPVLKTFLEPLLKAVPPQDPNFAKARELLGLLDKFATWPPDLAPSAALIREFIGGGSFDCH